VARPAAVLVAPAPVVAEAVQPALPADPRAQVRPQARPAGVFAMAPPVAAPPVETREETRAERRARERVERRVRQQAPKADTTANTTAKTTAGITRGGGLCGDPALVGEVIGRVAGAGGCEIDSAVRLRAVSGVRLSTPATIDCATARALKLWVDKGVIPAAGTRGGGVAELRVAASYACRARNNQSGARLSEHARGHAVDISGLSFRDGSSLTVLRDWKSGRDGRLMQSLHRAACGPFGTVLGPNSDRFHRDHFHFDTARHRSGPYCK
jgi:hypothetical protein